MIVIVDYDTGNTLSISKAFEKIGLETLISADPGDILTASGIILPGVGAFPKAMTALNTHGLSDVLKQAVAQGIPLLGICLGMQLLFEKSLEYGTTAGLGFIPGEVVPFPKDLNLSIPHMGWNQLELTQRDDFVAGMAKKFVYYVHSYYVACPQEFILAESEYGLKVPSVVKKGRVYGTQFHPEKSGQVGQELLKAFKQEVEK